MYTRKDSQNLFRWRELERVQGYEFVSRGGVDVCVLTASAQAENCALQRAAGTV